jgi:hypothetical protein
MLEKHIVELTRQGFYVDFTPYDNAIKINIQKRGCRISNFISFVELSAAKFDILDSILHRLCSELHEIGELNYNWG